MSSPKELRSRDEAGGSSSRMPCNVGLPRCKHFFKVILPSTLAENRLFIPKKFLIFNGAQLRNVAVLKVPNGSTWEIGLTKLSNKVCFDNGWPVFVKAFSIEVGTFVFFEFCGDSMFNIIICDHSACEIEYPENIDLFEDQEAEDDGDDVAVFLAKSNVYVSKVFGGLSDESRERVAKAFELYRPRKTAFMAIMEAKKHFDKYVYVPADFVRAEFKGNPHNIMLRAPNGDMWDATLSLSNGCGCKIKGGWPAFVRGNQISDGDFCIFELLEYEPCVFKVSIYPAM